jgi:ribosomal protein S6--L-glutamate ligase
VFYSANKLEVYYQKKKINPKKYLYFISQYYFISAEFANNLFIVNALNQLGIKVFNSLSSAIRAKNKRESLFILAQHGLPIIPTGINFSQFFLDQQLKHFGKHKIIAKANIGSMGYGVTVLDSHISFISFMEYMGVKEQPVNILVQPFMDAQAEDYRIFVVGNKVVATIKRKAHGVEFRPNISKGGRGTSIKPNKKIVNLAIKAIKVLGLEYAGVDIMQVKNKLMLIEVNSNPGLEIENITGINIVKKIVTHCIKKSK